MLIAPGFMSTWECRGTAPPPSSIRIIGALLLCHTSWNYQLEFGGCFTSTNSLSCTTWNGQKCNGICMETFARVQTIWCCKKHISWQERMDFTPRLLMCSIPVHSRLRQRECSSSIAPDPLHRYWGWIWGFGGGFLMFSSNLCGYGAATASHRTYKHAKN